MSRDEDDQTILLAHPALNFMTRWWNLLHMSFFRREEDMRATCNSTTTRLSKVDKTSLRIASVGVCAIAQNAGVTWLELCHDA